MNTENIASESVQTPSPADLSLADYRASREVAAAPAVKEGAKQDPPATGEELEENAAASGAADDTQEPASGATDEGKKAKPKGGFQKKIEARDIEIAELKRQLADQSAVKPAADGAAKPAAAADVAQPPEYDKAPKPKLEDFDGIESFTEALNDWKADEREFKTNWTKGREAFVVKQQAANTAWKAQVAESKTQHPDYDEVMDAVADVKLSPAHQAIFLESELGAELVYQLATDREMLERIATLSPTAAARELGKLEASLAKAPEPSNNTVSKAAKPFRSLAGGGASRPAIDVKNVSLGDYRRARESGRL
jgi:hypothetical protein